MSKGVAQLGYMGFEVKSLDAWEPFATNVLGLELASRTDSGFTARMDSYAHRFFIDKGELDDLAVLGWQVDDADALGDLVERLRGAGVAVTDGTPEEAARRKVEKLVKYNDPFGLPSELFYGPAKASTPFRSAMVKSGFVAEENGLGHCVLSASSQKESKDFYTGLLGFRLSDYIICDIYGFKVNIVFLHANARHHSVAFGDRQKKRIHHFMLETRSMDDVGLAMDRTMRSGLRIMQTLGRHPNDKMFSFYAKTPSGFQFEFGWGGRSVDDATWEPTTYDHISEWGHHPPEMLVPQKAPGSGPQAPGKSKE